MRIAVTGATGNLGTSVLGALGAEPAITEIVGIARRRPDLPLPKVRWEEAHVAMSSLEPLFQDMDAVIHLAWLVQPSHHPEMLERTNVVGSERVFRAAANAGVPKVIYASSVGAYSPGPKHGMVDEDWPTNGIRTSTYSVHKAAVERILDRFEIENPQLNWVRMRPGLIFKRESASEVHRLFLGRAIPNWLLSQRPVPLIPNLSRLVFQAVHASDVASAIHAAVVRDVRGAFNVAASPPIDARLLSEVAHAPRVPLTKGLLRGIVDFSWRLHLQPTEPGWIDMALQVPLMDSSRAHHELDWHPAIPAQQALQELLDGLAHNGGFATPPLRTFKQRRRDRRAHAQPA